MKKSIVVALGLGLLASSASAQGAGQNQPPDQWVMNCNTEQGRDCTVSAMIDGGSDNLLGTFLIVSYSVAYTTLSVVVDGYGPAGQHAGRPNPFVSTSICTGGECSYEQGKSSQLVQADADAARASPCRLRRSDDSMVGPLKQSLKALPPSIREPCRPSRAADASIPAARDS